MTNLTREARGTPLTLLIGALSLWLGSVAGGEDSSQATAGPQLAVRLFAEAECASHLVLLRDIAMIQGPTMVNGVRLADIEIAKIDGEVASVELTASRIRLCLLLAGVDGRRLRLDGAESVIVRQRSTIRPVSYEADEPHSGDDPDGVPGLTDLEIEQQIAETLAAQFGLGVGDVEVRLVVPFVASARAKSGEPPEYYEVLCPSVFPYGRTQLMLRGVREGRLIETRPAHVIVRRRHRVVVANHQLSPQRPISAADVSETTQFVVEGVGDVSLETLIGRSVVRVVAAQQIIEPRDLAPRTTIVPSEVSIRARDAVRVTARRKGLAFTVPAAEALQSGSVGQLIRVRNLHSNRILVARVVGPGEVEVSLE